MLCSVERYAALRMRSVCTGDASSAVGITGRYCGAPILRAPTAVTRRDVDMVAAWSLDRLGRSLTDLLGVLQELHAKGVHLYLHQQGLDTSTPSGRAMSQMLGVFAEFERAISGNGSWPDWRGQKRRHTTWAARNHRE